MDVINGYQKLAYAICLSAYKDLVRGYKERKYSLIKENEDFFYSRSFSVYCPNIDPDVIISRAKYDAEVLK